MAAPSAGGAARHQRTAKACARGGRWRHVGLVAAATSVPHQEFQCRAYQTLDLSEASCTHRERPRGGVRVRRRSLRRPRAASHELVVRRCGSQHEVAWSRRSARAGLEPPSGQVGRVRRSRLSAAGSLTCRSKTSLASSSPRSRCRMSRGQGAATRVISSWDLRATHEQIAPTKRRRVRRPRAGSPCTARGPRTGRPLALLRFHNLIDARNPPLTHADAVPVRLPTELGSRLLARSATAP